MNRWFFIFFVVAHLPIIAVFLWDIWRGSVLPGRIPKEHISKAAQDLHLRYGESALEIARREEQTALNYFSSFEHGRWQRIRQEIMRREQARNVSPEGDPR